MRNSPAFGNNGQEFLSTNVAPCNESFRDFVYQILVHSDDIPRLRVQAAELSFDSGGKPVVDVQHGRYTFRVRTEDQTISQSGA